MLLRIIARKKFYINAKMKMCVGDNFYITNNPRAQREYAQLLCGAVRLFVYTSMEIACSAPPGFTSPLEQMNFLMYFSWKINPH